jgi:hypothetical protein
MKISYGLTNEILIKQIMQKDYESIFSKPFQIQNFKSNTKH